MHSLLLGSPIDLETLKRELPSDFSVQDTKQKYYEFDDTGFSLFFLVVGWIASIPASVLANAIYDAIKKGSSKTPKRISINKIMIDFERGKIKKYIEEHIDCGEDRHE